MIKQSIEAIIDACNGVLVNKGNADMIHKVSTDTRTIEGDSLFIPLIGENFDGHQFIEEAVKKGANTVLIQEDKDLNMDALKNINLIKVKDTLEALKQIGKYYRNLFDIPFIGVTGSVGKTTTKDLISGALSGRYSVHKNLGNFNNQIGLPMTLFNLEAHHQISVLEMGMSSYGEILNLVDIVKPNIGIITNIGVSHIEHFGSKENIMKAKMEIATHLGKGDFLLVNGDDEHLRSIEKNDKEYTVVFYGLSPHNDFYPTKVEDLGENGSRFTIDINGKLETFRIKQLGLHNVYNGLAAVWIGLKYQMTAAEIQNGLDHFEPSKMRLEVINKGNMKIINDAYNASPDSMKAALDVLEGMTAERRIAILGNMFEMGSFAEAGHRSVGEYIAKKKIDILITVGDIANWIALEAKEKGFNSENIYSVSNNKEAINILDENIRESDSVLVKGSRGMVMEEIVSFLQERSL